MADYIRNIDHLPEYTTKTGISGIQYTVITDLAEEPITAEFFKAHAKIDFNTDDALISEYIKAARQELEQWAQLSFGVKTIVLTAVSLPKYYKLMYGPVASITGTDYTLIGDIVKEGGENVEITFTTKPMNNSAIKIAIAKYAAGLYAVRENIIINEAGNPVNGESYIDLAKRMLLPFRNVILI